MITYDITAEQSLEKLKEGNRQYMDSVHNTAISFGRYNHKSCG